MKIILAFLLIMLSRITNGQKAPEVYIYENIKIISVDSILNSGYLRINDTTYEIKRFTYVISVLDVAPVFGINQGDKFSDEFVTKLYKYPSRGDLMITDVFVQKKNSDEPSRKLTGNLNISFQNLYK